jgi:hypothetical protein
MTDDIKTKLNQALAVADMLDERTLTACENGIDGHEDTLIDGHSAPQPDR